MTTKPTEQDEAESKNYFEWSRSYFGHGMPPSQSFFEATMSAHASGIAKGRELERARVEELEKSVSLRVRQGEEDLRRIGARDERIATLEIELEGMWDELISSIGEDENMIHAYPLAAALAEKDEK